MENEYEIADVREQKDFSSLTFSEFKKSDVKKEFLKSLKESSLEPACFWCAEMVCSGYFIEIWDIIILFYSKHVQQGCPSLCVYIEHRVNSFREIARNGYAGNELSMRNNVKVRQLFCEIVCVLCDSSTRHPYDEVKIDESYFQIDNISSKLKAPDVSFAGQNFKKEDPKELYIAINELAYSVSNKGKNLMMACFWTEWLMSYQKSCKSKKQECRCERRGIVDVEEKFQKAVDWVIWGIFITESKTRVDKRITKIIQSMLNLYSLKYSNGTFRKRRFLTYLAISLLVENVSLNSEIVSKDTKEKIKIVNNKINDIYKQIKAKEKRPPTDYLFTNVKQSNLEKTIEKLDKMNEFGDKFTPRL